MFLGRPASNGEAPWRASCSSVGRGNAEGGPAEREGCLNAHAAYGEARVKAAEVVEVECQIEVHHGGCLYLRPSVPAGALRLRRGPADPTQSHPVHVRRSCGFQCLDAELQPPARASSEARHGSRSGSAGTRGHLHHYHRLSRAGVEGPGA